MFTPDLANPTGVALMYYIHTDHLDAPRIVVDRENRQRWRWISEPFGTGRQRMKRGAYGRGRITTEMRCASATRYRNVGCGS